MMTKKNALTIARNIYASSTTNTTTAEVQEVLDVLDRMIEQLSKTRTVSPEAKEAANAKRKDATAKARTALVEQVAPVLREVLTHTQQGMTAKEIFSEGATACLLTSPRPRCRTCFCANCARNWKSLKPRVSRICTVSARWNSNPKQKTAFGRSFLL